MQAETYSNSQSQAALGLTKPLTPDNDESTDTENKSQVSEDQETRPYDISLVSPPDSDHDVALVGSVTSDECGLSYHQDEMRHAKQLQFWKAQLEDSRPAELLLDMPRPAVLSGTTSLEAITIEFGLWKQLQRFCEQGQTAPFVVLLTAFRVAHYRMTGTSDAVIAAWDAHDNVTKRMSTKHLEIADYFRIKIDDQESFTNILTQVKRINDDIKDSARPQLLHGQVEASIRQFGKGTSLDPLARMFLNVNSDNDLHGGQFEDPRPESQTLSGAALYDIELHIHPEDDSLKLKILFSTDLFKEATIKNLLSIFDRVIHEGLNSPDTPVETLDLMTTEDHHALSRMDLLSPRITAYPRESTVVDIFLQQVEATPDFIAVKDKSSQLTYAELDMQSDAIALWLQYQKLPVETLVGVFAPRSCQVIIAFIGILKAGLAYLPFDMATPQERMKTILSSIEVKTIILTESVHSLPTFDDHVQFIKMSDILEGSAPIPRLLQEPLNRDIITATSLAYVMFTSGSTGRPKGVMVEHRGIVRLVKGGNMAEHLPKHTTMAHLTSIAFDNSTWEIYASLLTGGTLICVDAATVLDCWALGDVFIREGIQSTMLTPALLKQYLIGCPDAIAALEMMCVQGEKAIVEDMFLAKQLSGGAVINAYGPTENTVTSTFFVLSDLERCTNGVPIGGPISNSGVHVMDPEQRLVPLGVIGELIVTGDGLARGYDDPERNVDRFISITVNDCTVPAYRTGDYVRHRPVDGQLEFFGRIDGQVKIHGNRIELGEIEHVIRSHQYVSEAVAVVQSNSRDPRLAAYLTLREVRPGSIEESTLVETWLDHWDVKTYTPITNIQLQDIGRDFIGWTSMNDGSDIPRDEMNEWLDETIDTILDGKSAGHILEVGTGSGMILFNLNRGLESYIGIEPSGRAVDFVRQAATLMPEFQDKVTMHRGTAGDLNQLCITNPPDTAILNSVIQYFPSQDYLLSVIRSLIKIGATRIFLGDVRSYALHREFLVARALFIVRHSRVSPAEFRRIMSDIEKAESELLLDPSFFTRLPESLPIVHHVEILPKRIKAVNELSCYRYDVVLHIRNNPGTAIAQPLDIEQQVPINFKAEKLNYDSLLCLLEGSHESTILVVENIPDSKTSLERGVIESLDRLEENSDADINDTWLEGAHRQASLQSVMSTTDLEALAQEKGWQVQLSWARHYTQRGGLDAVFHRGHSVGGRVKFRFPVEDQSRPYRSLSSHPLRREVRRKVQDQLQRLLHDTLPSYMIPQSFTFLDKLPVNQNGKVDRKAIASYIQRKEVPKGQSHEIMSKAEGMMQTIWSEVLGLGPSAINRNTSFFNLGGDSIGAMMVVNESRKAGIKIAVADIFRWPVLHELASNTRMTVDHPTEEIAPFSLLGDNIDVASLIKNITTCYGVSADAVEDVFPCTPLQEGLIFETLKRPGDYLRQAVMKISHGVTKTRLMRAWERVIRAKPILRTRVIQHDQLGLLQVVTHEPVDWVDASTLDLQGYLEVDKQKSMDLGKPLSRYAILESPSGVPKWLVWSSHHALYDGWSLHLLQNALYRAYEEEFSPIEPGPQFQSFIKWVKDVDAEESSMYWQRVLQDCQHSLFPSIPAAIGHPVAEKIIRDFIPLPPSSGTDITTSNLIRAAWGLVMGQMTNSDDVLYGMTLYGRNAPVADIDKLAAPTISTVPIRVQIDKSQTCAEFLVRVQTEATEMIPYEQTGLQNIMKSVRSNQDSCKFQTQLVVQTGEDHCNECPFGQWQQGSEEHGFITYAFTLELWLHDDRIATTAMFDSRVITSWLVKQMISRLSSVMNQLSRALPTQVLSELEICTPEDREQIWDWNETVPTAIEECVHKMFQRQVARNPEALAIIAWDGSVSYKQLDDLSSRVAKRLITMGVEDEVIVPLCFEKSMWTTVAILGILKAGGGFVMLDPTLPERRLEDIVQQINAGVILSSTANKDLVSHLAKQRLTIDWDLFDAPEALSDTWISWKAPTPSSLLYVIFTSGSTGTPKGVVITHRNLSSALHHQAELGSLTPSSKLYDFASYNFDVSISNMFTVLAAGAALCVPKDEERQNNLEESIRVSGANALDLTPCVAQLLSPSRLPDVRSLTLGGEALHALDIKQWWEVGNVRIRNAYGPCECTPTSAFNRTATTLEALIQIGTGAGAVTWIVDPEDHNQLLPPGCTGELLLEGPIVGRGYLNDAARTAAQFIDDPTWLLRGSPGKPGRHGRLYKTGDLVKYNQNGSLTYVSRKDHQVKVRGQRIELGEIEHALRSQHCVDEAVAVLHGDTKESAQIAAFVTIDDESTAAQDQLKEDGESEQQTRAWEVQFDGEVYSSMDSIQPHDIGRDFVGWSSMISGEEFDHGDMNEWLDDTLKCILNGRDSIGNVLEIGTGSGMILFNLAHALQSYVGVEPSEKAVDFVGRSAARIPQLKDKVRLFKGTASDISWLASGTPVLPDMVIINSVLQYFPSQEYLLDVIRDILHLGSVKTIFFGDVRSLVLHKEFLAMRAIQGQPQLSQEDLRRMLLNMQKSEPELLVDPAFFTGLSERLPGLVSHVEILPKIMEATNELACYRYAAVVHLASADLQHRIRHISNDSWIDAKAQNLDLHAMEALLDPISGPDTVAISNIPYSKIAFPRAIVEAVEGQQLDNMRNRNWLSKAGEHAATSISLSPLDLVELAQRLNYRIELSWARQSSQSGGLDAIFYRHDDLNGKPQRTLFCFPHDHSSRQYQSLTSKPLRQRAQGNALQRLKSSIESVLPRYMLPQSITILDQLPINRNGKVDRRKLAESFVTDQKTEETKQQPTKAMEREMQRIWSEVLNIKPDAIGLHDGFIQLGGNSLDAMRVVTMARHADMNLSVTDMFRHSVTSIYQLTLQLESAYEYESGSAARRVDPTHLITDIARCDARIAAVPLNLDQATGIENPRKLPTVLLTGANGFIGTQILRQLLEDNRVGRVIAIVRGDSAEAARGRLIDVAKKALWWTEFHDAPLEVWPGDLSLPRLGLDPSRWDPIQNGAIDIIIHNAAAVHFIKSYEALKPANVGSTVEMLCVASSNPRTKFVYVSSARHEDPTEEQEETVAKHLAANSNGYMQTKFVSEALVRRAALRNASGRNQFSIVSPGLVIGTLTEGYSNTDDWIWRLAAACVRVGMYNADNAATWIPISDVGTVARIIVETVMSSRSSSQPIVQIKGGLTLGDFWETLIGLGYELEGRSGSECATAIRQDIESAKEDHPLWTLSDVLGDLEDTAQDTWAASWYEEKTCPVRLRVAIQKTVRYLEGIGFL